MALHPHWSPVDSIRWRSILGDATFPARLPLRATLDTHAHSFRPLPTLDSAMSLNLGFPPQILQPRLGGEHDTHRLDELHDER